MSETTKYVEVEIFGERYKLITQQKSEERILKICKRVDHTMQHLAQKFPNYSKLQISVLTALNLADEWLKISDELTESEQKIFEILNFMQHAVPESQ